MTLSSETGSALADIGEIRVLTLSDNAHQDSSLYRLKKGWTLRVRLGPSLFGTDVTVWTNHPEDSAAAYDRDNYRVLPWKSDSGNRDDDTAIYTDILIVAAGPFHYYFTSKSNHDDRRGSGYFVVDPVLTYGETDEVLPLDCIQCQTYLSKCLGTFDGWENRLRVAKESGYNMIHFTPIQSLGESHSAYSLNDQHRLNPMFSSAGKSYSLADVGSLTKKMRDQWKVLSLCDIVLNHSANDSLWLKEHPECAYNLENSPHLRPAYVLDRLIWHFALEISEGKWTSSGIPPNINQMDHLNSIKAALHGYFLPQVKISEFYLTDVDKMVRQFYTQMQGLTPTNGSPENLELIQDQSYRRFGCTVDINKAVSIFNVYHDGTEEERVQKCCQMFRHKLEVLNDESRHLTHIHLQAAVDNIIASLHYERIQDNGPRISEVSREHPLVPMYFTHYGPEMSLRKETELAYGADCKYIMAHNGWVMGDDPLRNFAEPSSNVYLRRELIAWGDSVKLRYGEKPEDCPYLWEHMRKYSEQTAEIFHGIRLDNCHSTPIHAAEYMIDAARKVRPDLYVVAELFTSSELIDNIFVNRLGINSLIRESMSAQDSHEEGRLVYRYGGDPVGAFSQGICRPLNPSIAHALFFDLTHDNPSPVEKRSVYDLLPSAALVSMASCGTGSNWGYDELVPHHVHVVSESRIYSSWSDTDECSSSSVGLNSGIIAGKKVLNDLHFQLGLEGFNEVYVDQVDKDIVTVTRHCPRSHRSVILVAFTAFSPPFNIREKRWITPLSISGVVDEVIFEARLNQIDHQCGYEKDVEYINGLIDYSVEIRQHFQLHESQFVRLMRSHEDSGRIIQEIEFTHFYPGSVIAFRVCLDPPSHLAISKLRNCFENINIEDSNSTLNQIIDNLTLADINRVLFRCDNEERDEGKGIGIYQIKNADIPYCGLQGLVTLLSDIRPRNDLGHQLCDNLRQGNWLMDYISNRLKLCASTKELGIWLEEIFSPMKSIPRYLIPRYFDTVIICVYSQILDRTWKLMSKFVSDGSVFVRLLALGSIILCGVVHSAPLPKLSANLRPPLVDNFRNALLNQTYTTLSAGLPHFSTGYMRNWGRDTFIALKGLLLITGRHDEARFIILGFGGCLRHGLIPNLLDGGSHARFNCRDAVWWWLQSIQDYCKIVPEGWKILKDNVLRLFPTDDAEAYDGLVENILEDVIYEALQRHVTGVRFRERNAGFNLDREMSDAGFNNEIGVDLNTGFVFGGNEHNCGTWMDKMGSSVKAGTKGKPATPRDGSAVEIVGLCRSVLMWLQQLLNEGKFPYNSFTTSNNGKLTIEEWSKLIDENFERCFWIARDKAESVKDRHPELINHRGIYKDTFMASASWRDYQFRCNFPVAIALAPEMVDPEHAWIALEEAEKCLLGPLGMKTLSEDDWAYCGYYDNSNDSADPKVANGYNYHQGPEWLWPVGYFLRAKLKIACRLGDERILDETVSFIKKRMSKHFEELQKSPWRGLPELTNRNGEFCPGSCHVQAWSVGCLLEVLYDMNEFSHH